MTEAHILLIEDSSTQAQQIRLILESAGYQVSVAAMGNQGLAMAQALVPDLILLDVILPDLDGYKVCRRLRQQGSPYIPVLMLTARSAVEDKVEGLQVGADDYLPKPFDERELLARVNALLRVRQQQGELQYRLEEVRQSQEVWRRVAITDHLTGLYNRHYFAEVLQQDFEAARRYNTPLACIMVDIDHFRDFNTRYGHAIGDVVLQGVAHILKESVRRADVVARYGGEEFVVLMPMSNVAAATVTASRLREMVEARVWESAAGPLQTTISLGVASFPEIKVTRAEDLVICADRAMYQAKEQGRNRVVVLTSPDDKQEQGERDRSGSGNWYRPRNSGPT